MHSDYRWKSSQPTILKRKIHHLFLLSLATSRDTFKLVCVNNASEKKYGRRLAYNLVIFFNADSGNASNGKNRSMIEEALAEAKLQLEKEEEELEKAISGIATQTKEIEDKIVHFEDFELQMERKRQHFQQLQDRLFADQLTLLFNKTAAPKMGENIGEAVKSE